MRLLRRSLALALAAALMLTCPALSEADAQSLYARGMRYYEGDGVPQNFSQAAEFFAQAAEQGSLDAQLLLAEMALNGEGMAADGAVAAQYYRLAAEQGSADAQLALGEMYRDGAGVEKDEAQAVEWYRLAAEQGDARGQLALGEMYMQGAGVEKDEAQAVEWYRLAAEQGDAAGLARMGDAFMNGAGVERDEAQAAQWYALAAQQGDPDAAFALSGMYAEGTGVERDEARSAEYLAQAAEQGSAQAQVQLGQAYESGAGVEESPERAFELYSAAAEQGDAQAQYLLGNLYESGSGTEKDYAQAFAQYSLAAEQGLAPAQRKLGELYERGDGTESDWLQAVEWYARAAEQGDAEAGELLNSLVESCAARGARYASPSSEDYDEQKALAYLTTAAAHGYAQAKLRLAQLYTDGEQIERDFAAAVELLQPLAEQGDQIVQDRLVGIYETGGPGVEKDAAKAIEWCARLIEQNIKPDIYQEKIMQLVAEDPQLFEQLVQAIDGGDEDAWQFALELRDYCYDEGLNWELGIDREEDIQQARQWYLLAAELGEQGALGELFKTDEEARENIDDIIVWLTRAAERDDVDAQATLGTLYATEESGVQDREQAIRWLTSAAEQGDDYAQQELVALYMDGEEDARDYAAALRLLTPLAEAGDADAQRRIVRIYTTGGYGVDADPELAAQWQARIDARLAEAEAQEAEAADRALAEMRQWDEAELQALLDAEADDPDARAELDEKRELCKRQARDCRLNTYTYAKDKDAWFSRAHEWYLRAATLGDAEAQAAVAQDFYSGVGVARDVGQAIEWYTRAAEQGSEDAQLALGSIYLSGDNGVESDPNLAIEWYTRAAEQGSEEAQLALQYLGALPEASDAQSQFELGQLYEQGTDTIPQDTQRAIEAYKNAAEQGHVMAQRRLIGLYLRQNDYPSAIQWLLPLAQQDPPDLLAVRTLAQIYLEGYGDIEPDPARAIEWYRIAAEHGDAESQYWLGSVTENGLYGVEQDASLAAEYYSSAAQGGSELAQIALDRLTIDPEQFEQLKQDAQSGDAQAQASLEELRDRCFDHANFCEQQSDWAQAILWQGYAAELGKAESQYAMGMICEFGYGMEPDRTQAAEWYALAEAQGDPNAQYGVERLRAIAERDAYALRDAAAGGDADAQRSLDEFCAYCIEQAGALAAAGADESQSTGWYICAAELGNEDAKNLLSLYPMLGLSLGKYTNDAVARISDEN